MAGNETGPKDTGQSRKVVVIEGSAPLTIVVPLDKRRNPFAIVTLVDEGVDVISRVDGAKITTQPDRDTGMLRRVVTLPNSQIKP